MPYYCAFPGTRESQKLTWPKLHKDSALQLRR